MHNEINWALQDEYKTIIPILHAGLTTEKLEAAGLHALTEKQLIAIAEDISSELVGAISTLKAALRIY